MDKDSKFTRDDEGYIAVRVVTSTEALPAIDKDYLFARDENGNIAMRVVGAGGGGGGSVNYNRVVEKATVIPDASTQEVGKVYMYMGTTNSTYTHGYIYENVAEQTASDVTFSGNIISSWAVADFVNYLQEGGSAYNEVTNGTLTYSGDGDLWVLVGLDSNGNEVLRFQEYTEDLEDFGCVFASQTHQDGDNCTFTLTTTVSGKKWKRMDVQPGGGTVSGDYVPQYDTMPSAGASNLGDVVQYSGATNETYTNGYFYKNIPQMTDSSATISQTSGVVPATATFTTASGDVSISADPEDVENFYLKHWTPMVPDTIFIAYNPDTAQINASSVYYGAGFWTTQEEMEAEGFVFSGIFGAGCQVNCAFVPGQRLQNLSVNVKTFETAEQPTGNKTVNFVAGKTTLSVLSGNNGGMTVTVDPDVLVSRFPEILSGMSEKRIYKISVNGNYLENSGWDNNLRAALLIYSGPDTLAMSLNLDTDTNRDYYGITISGVGFEQNIEYTIISNSLVENPWAKNGTTVDIAEYGISYSGMPNENDTLTVEYLAPSVIGYGWEQLNVQPEPKEGIDWKVKLDLPAEYTGDLWNVFPVYTIAGGLPDGRYKLYFSTKQYSEYAQSGLYAENVFCVLLDIKNDTREFQGVMGYVFDGEYIPSPSTAYALERLGLYTFVASKGDDIIIYSTNMPFYTNVLGNIGSARLIPECFKISAITNVETGEEYIPTGYVPLDGQLADINNYSGQVVLAQLGNQPYIPSRSIVSTLSDSEVNNGFGLRVSTCGAPKTYIRCSSGNDVFYAYVYRTPNEYEQEILQATGKFENWKFKFFSTGNIYVDIDLGTPDFTSPISVVAGVFGADATSGFNIAPVNNSGELAPLACPYVGIGKSCRMETPTANQLGGVVQYVGETDANYTKGANYTAKGTVVVIPESAVATNIDPNIATISIDASALIPALSSYTGWAESYIRDQLNNGHTWQIGYDFDNNQIISLFWSLWGGFDASIWSAFTVTPDSGQSGTQTINFVIQYTPESKELQNGYWELLQPGSSLPDQTGNAGKFLTTDGTDASWGDTLKELFIKSNNSNYYSIKLKSSGSSSNGLYYVENNNEVAYCAYNTNSHTWTLRGPYSNYFIFDELNTCLRTNSTGGSLGNSSVKWDSIYVTKINNGADIAVPTTGGTMVVATPPTTDGTYVLKATVSSGTVTYAWVAE